MRGLLRFMYANADLNGDGFDELAVGKIGEDDTCEIYDLYTFL